MAGNFGNTITLVAHDGLTLPNAAAVTEIGGAAGRFRTRVNLPSDNHLGRLVVGVSVAGAATEELVVQSSTDGGSTWTDFLPPATLVGVAGTASAGQEGPVGNSADLLLRLVTRNGNGATSPVIGLAMIQLHS